MLRIFPQLASDRASEAGGGDFWRGGLACDGRENELGAGCLADLVVVAG